MCEVYTYAVVRSMPTPREVLVMGPEDGQDWVEYQGPSVDQEVGTDNRPQNITRVGYEAPMTKPNAIGIS